MESKRYPSLPALAPNREQRRCTQCSPGAYSAPLGDGPPVCSICSAEAMSMVFQHLWPAQPHRAGRLASTREPPRRDSVASIAL